MVDEGLLFWILKAGGLNPQITRRLCHHVIAAEEAGADIIVVTCSSVSPAVDTARKLVSRPVLKIDEPMAETAITKGKRIGIVATVATTLEPTFSLLKEKAHESGKEISTSVVLCSEAFEAILRGEAERHDRLVTEKAKDLAQKVDVIVLAQGSMARLAPSLSREVSIPVLSSPPLFMEKLKTMLRR
jgi:Asp/Glu/hydantoin racemase